MGGDAQHFLGFPMILGMVAKHGAIAQRAGLVRSDR